MFDDRDQLFWNAVRFIVLCPYNAHRMHNARKRPGSSGEKTRTVRIDCPTRVPIQQLATAAHFTWPDAVFRVGEIYDDLLADPDDRSRSWDDENYADLYVFVPVSNTPKFVDETRATRRLCQRRQEADPSLFLGHLPHQEDRGHHTDTSRGRPPRHREEEDAWEEGEEQGHHRCLHQTVAQRP